ncbi:MAG: NAD(P)/FAD-dependent oxidoreductase [bacterium]|nr:NAD(P)/FAD-dependent oxidoreductase [bacterium]
MEKNIIAIIGAGPAGIACALQLKRYGIPCLLFEKNRAGGLLQNANLVENYPGFPQGITGLQLVERLQEQLRVNDIPVTYQEVRKVEFKDGGFAICTSEAVHHAGILVAAAGTAPRQMGTAPVNENGDFPSSSASVRIMEPGLEKKIFYDVYSLVKEKSRRFLVIGAGDAAFDYALNLSRHNDVVIANRGTKVKALPLLMERVDRNPRITYWDDMPLKKIARGIARRGTNTLSVTLCRQGEEVVSQFDFLLCAIGREPQVGYYGSFLREKAKELKAKEMFYEIGDVVNGIYRQAVIAAGNGIETAMKISRGVLDVQCSRFNVQC